MLTDEQLAIIQEQNVALRQSEIDIATVKTRLERQTVDLNARAEREIREINARAIQRVQELGEEYKRLPETGYA